MDNDSTNQPPTNDPYSPMNQSAQPMPGANDLPSNQPQPPVPQGPANPVQPQQSQRPPLRIDHNLLAELGLAALPEEEKKALEKHIYETLEMRVGMRLADQMTNEQLDEFETYFNARDDAGAFHWLETNFPNYKDIVADEFDKLKSEVAGQAPAILAASMQQATEQSPSPQVSEPLAPQMPAEAPQPMPQAPQPPAVPQEQPMPQQQPQQWPTPPMPSPSSDDQQPPQQPAAQ